ncbi:ARM repeat superfamily protein [Raphanus sativus]|nr:ARM repeat superfamily protein [Raphanus sativus]
MPFVPKLTLSLDGDSRDNLMQAFSTTFSNCKPESPLKLACISVVRNLIIPNGDILYHNDPILNNYQLAWPNKVPPLLNQLGDKHPVSSQVVLKLLLDLGRVAFLKKVSPTFEEDIIKFFNPYQGEGDVPGGGSFVSLRRDVQELALSFLYYFTIGNFCSPLLRAVVSCCLDEQLEPDVLYRIVKVLHDSYKDGYIPITDHFSFIITLIARFRVVRGGSCLESANSAIESVERRETTFKALTELVCAYLSRMGDSFIVLQIIEKVCVEQTILKPALNNGCGILRMIYTLDSKPTRLSESSVTTISEFLPGYLIDMVNCIPEDKDKSSHRYYLEPCISLFDRSSKLTEEVLKRMGLMVSENTKAIMLESSSVQQDRESSLNSLNLIQDIVSVIILLMQKEVEVWKILSPFKSEIDLILQNVIMLQSSSLAVEGKHIMKIAGERLRTSLVRCTTVTVE